MILLKETLMNSWARDMTDLAKMVGAMYSSMTQMRR